ncbi:MAG TPA: hypothetical protein VI299_17750 [Polyangiales bacterium]
MPASRPALVGLYVTAIPTPPSARMQELEPTWLSAVGMPAVQVRHIRSAVALP